MKSALSIVPIPRFCPSLALAPVAGACYCAVLGLSAHSLAVVCCAVRCVLCANNNNVMYAVCAMLDVGVQGVERRPV